MIRINDTFAALPVRIVLLALVAVGLTACGGGGSELDDYIDEVKARPGKRPDPLPEIKQHETFVYRADESGTRSPFMPDQPTVGVAGTTGPRPDTSRSREFLESFPLDSLDMVGTLQLNGRTYGLVQDVEGLVHRVLPGNYVGQNDGRVTAVTESEIQVMEIVSDGIGGYLERDAAISLAD